MMLSGPSSRALVVSANKFTRIKEPTTSSNQPYHMFHSSVRFVDLSSVE